jgi:hexosaminidase
MKSIKYTVPMLAIGLSSFCGAESQWYKGNTHTHTFWSDGKEFPETAAARYREMGYHFLALSDHNVALRGERWKTIQEKNAEVMAAAVARSEARWGKGHLQFREKDGKRQVRLMPLDEVRERVEEPGRFIMIESVELTSGLSSGKQVHSNPVNIQKPLTVVNKSPNTVEQELALHEKLVHGHIAETDHPVFWHINHPNWRSSITGEQLAAVEGAHGVEIMNASGGCLNEGNGADLPPMEQVWDIANTIRLQRGLPVMYGCATDDTHVYHHEEPHASGPGLAWVMVKSPELTADAITAAMLRGDFYSSTGITLKNIDFDAGEGTYTIEVDPVDGVTYTIRFVGSTAEETGKVFRTVEGSRAIYRLDGSERFVRAAVTCDAPAICAYDEFGDLFPKAWTQPVAVPPGAGSPAIIPRPVDLRVTGGTWELKAGAVIAYADAAAKPPAERLAAQLRPATGFELPVRRGERGDIVFRSSDEAALGPEGYVLRISDHVSIEAPQPAGLFYGAQTLRQLLPPEVYSGRQVFRPWKAPAVEIRDLPRFSWRGMHLDVGRHFMPKEDVMRFIDTIASMKFNTFHWHLTEDQGWRIEIKKYPKLTGVGAWRKETVVGHLRDKPRTYDGTPHGGFYTQDEIREVVAYAAERHVTVVPEIDMPGHMQAAIAAYPELGCTTNRLGVKTEWGICKNILNPEESTVQFCRDVLTEVMELFPSVFIHIGGDEAKKDQWEASERIQVLREERGLKDMHEMQSWFIRQIDVFLTANGRRLIGWDEIAEGGLAENAAVMWWRGKAGQTHGLEIAKNAAQRGHDIVVASNGSLKRSTPLSR